MKYILQFIGILIVFIIFVIGWLACFLWNFKIPPVTFEATLQACKEIGNGDDYDY